MESSSRILIRQGIHISSQEESLRRVGIARHAAIMSPASNTNMAVDGSGADGGTGPPGNSVNVHSPAPKKEKGS